MKISSWYNNGSLDAFHRFCTQNRCKTIWVKLRDRSDFLRGVLYKQHIHPYGRGLYVLLSPGVKHPAYFGLEDIESIHEYRGETDSKMPVRTAVSD